MRKDLWNKNYWREVYVSNESFVNDKTFFFVVKLLSSLTNFYKKCSFEVLRSLSFDERISLFKTYLESK